MLVQVYLLSRWVVAVAFGMAAVMTLRDLSAPLGPLADLPLFEFAVRVAPWVEATLAATLVVNLSSSWPLTLLATLILTYSVLLLVLEHHLGIPAESCRCFGNALTLPLKPHLMLNGALLAVIACGGVLHPRAAKRLARRGFSTNEE